MNRSLQVRRGLAMGCFAAIVAVNLAPERAQAQVLDQHLESLTDYKPTAVTRTQKLRPRADQRGVDIDGTLRAYAPLGWTVHADPLGGGYSSGRTLGDVNLFNGTYSPTEVDLALPTLGLPIVIGRTYNSVQESSSPAHIDSDGYQGWNWAQMAQPELVFQDGATDADDMVYLVYGADRYIEFDRVGTGPEFKAKNGAAGVMQFVDGGGGADTWTYTDQRGNRIVFLGFDPDAGNGAGQLWTMTDPAGETAYVHSLTKTTAASGGYESDGRIKTMYDASGRKYVFSYATFGSKTRLQTVAAQIDVSTVWTTIAQVDYDYYTTKTTVDSLGIGDEGDLKTVTVTMKGIEDGDYVRTKHYRYYTDPHDNSAGERGNPHQIRMVVGFEGVRKYGVNCASHADSLLMSYSESYIEYAAAPDFRISKVTFNGNCGCGGGASGEHALSYTDGPSHATEVSDDEYQSQGPWASRTRVLQPDGMNVYQYFDEVGQVLGRVLSATDPPATNGDTWITNVVRDASYGWVTQIRTPANSDNANYNHTSGDIDDRAGDGLVTKYGRVSSGNLAGLRTSISVMKGTSDTPTPVSSLTLNERVLVVGSSDVSVPVVATSSTYPNGTALTTTIDTDYWDEVTDTNPTYIAPKVVTVTAPAVDDTRNGSDTSTITKRYLRTDGSTAFTMDATGIVFYTGRTPNGQTAKTIADCMTDTPPGGTFLSGEAPGDWGIPAADSDRMHGVTSYVYDNQGRMIETTRPAVGDGSGGNTRTSVVKHGVNGGLYYTFACPLVLGGDYHGPLSFSQVNHAGKPVRQATIKIDTPDSSFPTTTPDSDWASMVDHIYDNSGMRLAETRTYTDDESTYDTANYGYDAMGRRVRIMDATGTITRTVLDGRGLTIERWIGTNDYGLDGGSGSGTNDMTQVEAMEYDGGAPGENGLLTTRTQDEDGNWGTNTDQRATVVAYDFRNRSVLTENPVHPHTLVQYDNANRVIAMGQYSAMGSMTIASDPTSTTSNRVGLSETSYDERGQVWQSVRWEIDQSDGSKGTGLYVDNWYDGNGRLVKSVGPQITKTTYDRLGRALGRYTMATTDDGATYANALMPMGDDTVMEESHTVYDPTSGRALLQYTVQRAHDDPLASDSGTGGMLDPGADVGSLTIDPAAIAGRVQITALMYDDHDRVEYSTSVGTFSGAAYDYAAERTDACTGGDVYLRTQYTFDGHGRVWKVTDVADVETRTTYDFGGRRLRTVENYTDGAVGGGAKNDEDRITDYTYHAGGRVATVTRRMPDVLTAGDADQETSYVYGVEAGTADSLISDNRRLFQTVLPVQFNGQDLEDHQFEYAYNALGEVIQTTDPNANIIQVKYDGAGRVLERFVYDAGPGVDERVKKIVYAYTPRGQLEAVTQKDGSNVTLDSMAYVYDGWGNLITQTQDPIDRDEFVTGYSYTNPGALDGVRRWVLESTTPVYGGQLLQRFDDAKDLMVGRPWGIADDFDVVLAQYTYLGLGTVVGVEHPEPSIFSRIYEDNKSEMGGEGYENTLDAFSRPMLNQWVKDNTSGTDPAFLDLEMAWNRYGQPVTVQDNVLMDASSPPVRMFDQENIFDDLRRLDSRIEGEQSAGSIVTQSRKQILARNLAGRTITDQVSLNSDADFTDGPPNAMNGGEMDDTREYNKRNELRGRSVNDSSNPSTPRTVVLDYDNNGNLIDDGEKYKYVYNPFGQLVKITLQNDDPIAIYTYNGLGQRISEQLDTNKSDDSGIPDDLVDGYDPVFFLALDGQGRRVATYRETDDYPKETFVWHPAGMNGPVFKGGVIARDRNDTLVDPTLWATETAGDTRAQRHYAASDFKGDVIALLALDGDKDGKAKLAEQYRYSATGIPIGIPLGDVDGDFEVTDNAGDKGIIDDIDFNNGYEVRADLNLDGVVDSDDVSICDGQFAVVLGRGEMSDAPVTWRVGYRQMEGFGEGFGVIWTNVKTRSLSDSLIWRFVISEWHSFSTTLTVSMMLPTTPPSCNIYSYSSCDDSVNVGEDAHCGRIPSIIGGGQGPVDLRDWQEIINEQRTKCMNCCDARLTRSLACCGTVFACRSRQGAPGNEGDKRGDCEVTAEERSDACASRCWKRYPPGADPGPKVPAPQPIPPNPNGPHIPGPRPEPLPELPIEFEVSSA